MTTNLEMESMHSNSSNHDGEKDIPQQIEHIPSVNDGAVVDDRMPTMLRNMTALERQTLNKQLRQRIDRRLLPFMLLMYILNYLDRNNIASARLAHLEEELKLKGSEYQTSVSILFVGYLLMQVPSNMLLNKFGKPAVYLPCCMLVWGVISGLTGAVQNYAGLLVCRFFLGFVEAAYFPGCLFLLSSWYTREELVFRTAILYSGSLISGAFSGLLAAGITGGMQGVRGLNAWRWLFILEGVITVLCAFVALFVLPNFPRTTKWLTEEQKAMAVWRLQEDIGSDDWTNSSEQSIFHGALLAVKDSKAWVLLLTIYGFTSCGTVTNFFPTVVQTLGFNKVNTLLLTAPPYVLGTIVILFNAWHADRTRERYLHVVIGPVISMIMFILVMTTNGFGPRYFAMMVMIGSNYSGYVVALGWISNVLPRPPAKRAAALAGINALSNVCQIYSSYLYPTSGSLSKPHYYLAMSFNVGTSLMSIVFATLLRHILRKANRKLAQGAVIGHDGILRESVTTLEDPEKSGGETVATDNGFRFLV
ncbi:MFS general substrate transporter-10 [Coleophoma cylindrospora]|uniref:MFS general substrate transporter-10 n=1 Tax=Coleophoma cylindrospora TaxID=1849047 RepID=A0A3D8QXM0_9HELO|nr:MFS general substrate transporter-10 [Coleophoma cylindrospora]